MSIALNQKNQVEIYSNEEMDLLKTTLCKGCNNEQFKLFLKVCAYTGLNPFLKQIYPVVRDAWDKDSRQKIPTMTIQTSIDGYRLIADRTGKYCPGREATYTYNSQNELVSATAYIKKRTPDGTWHEISATAFYDEYVQQFEDKETKKMKPTKFWENMPHNQLAKCAESLALRKAFPADLSGIYTKEEMTNGLTEAEVIPIERVNQDTGQIEAMAEIRTLTEQIVLEEESAPILYMTRNHVEELEAIIGDDKEFLKSVLNFYKKPFLDEVTDDKYEVIKVQALKKRKMKK